MWNSYQTVRALRQAEKAVGLARERFHVNNLLRFDENKLIVDQINQHLLNRDFSLATRLHGLVSLLWAKSHGLSEQNESLVWSLDRGILPKQFIVAESVEMLTIGYSFDNVQGFDYAPLKNYLVRKAQQNMEKLSEDLADAIPLLNRATAVCCDLPSPLAQWEEGQIQSHILSQGCRIMAILAEHDEFNQKLAFEFGRNFALASCLAQSLHDYHTNSEVIHESDLPLMIYLTRHRPDPAIKDFLDCSRTVHKARNLVLKSGPIQLCEQVLSKYISRCKENLPETSSASKDAIHSILASLESSVQLRGGPSRETTDQFSRSFQGP